MEGSNTGALTLLPSIEGVLECTVLVIPFERADMEEMFEKVEEIDSFDAFLDICRVSDGLLGGSAGEGCVDIFLAGNLGGGAGAGFAGSETICPVRTMFAGGGNTPFLLGPLGSLPMPLLDSLLNPEV